MSNKLNRYIGTRIPETLEPEIKDSIERNRYATISEFLRAAIREKIDREDKNNDRNSERES
jgi:Arc/MetJ-type ribon-helix-helix transcriptional regulator